MRYLVLGVGTDIGKTFFVENFCRKNPDFAAIKPVASGVRYDDENSDSAKILAALGLEISQKNLDAISPWRFEMPASPHIAAKKIGEEINFVALKNFCLEKIKEHPQLLIEGAGGVMTPINDNKTFLDLAAELPIPVLLITANYLGAISHTLCAVEALRARKITISAILVNEIPAEKESLMNVEELVTTLRNFSNCEVQAIGNFLEKVS